MTPDEQFDIWKNMLEEARKHTEMSPKTEKKFEELQILIQNHIQNEEEKFNSMMESINNLHRSFSEFRIETKTKLDYIQEQTTKTNGRVTNLETHDKNIRDKAFVWLIRFVFLVIGALALTVLQKTGTINLIK